MISFVEPLPAGNAVRLHLSPPRGAKAWRVLRRPTIAFTGPDDPGAVRVGDPNDPRPGACLDTLGLINGVEYAYREYVHIGGQWVDGSTVTATPRAIYAGDGPDALAVVRERFALGLAEEVRRGALKPASGKVAVVTALHPLPDSTKLPCVSVHLDADEPAARFIGEQLEGATFPSGIGADLETDLDDSEGYLSRLRLNVVGISLNGDERNALRRALKRIFIANLPIWETAGLSLVDFAQRDDERPGDNNAVLYATVGAFACTAPARVSWTLGAIADVDVSASIPGQEEPVTNG